MKRSLIGLADLAHALETLGEAGQDRMATLAALLGFRVAERRAMAEEFPPRGSSGPRDDLADATIHYDPTAVPFWRLEAYEAVALSPPPPPEEARPARGAVLRQQPMTDPPFVPLISSSGLRTQLRRHAAVRGVTREVNLDEAVARLSRGEWLKRLPRQKLRRWGAEIHVIDDRSLRLVPYGRDRDEVCKEIQRIYPPEAVTYAQIGDGDREPTVLWPETQRGPYRLPRPGAVVLALSDLGCLAEASSRLPQLWQQWGCRWRENGNRTVALAPMRRSALPAALARVWTMIPWGASETARGGSASPRESALERLWALVSPVVRLEPGLLRALRRLLPEGREDPGLEALLWQHPGIRSRHGVAASLEGAPREEMLRRAATLGLSPALWRAALATIRRWHARLSPVIWFEELMSLDARLQRVAVHPADVEDANAYFRDFAERPDDLVLRLENAAWTSRWVARFPSGTCSQVAFLRAMHKLYRRVYPGENKVPGWYDPAFSPHRGEQEQDYQILQVADQLRFQAVATPSGPSLGPGKGSPWARLRTTNGEVRIAEVTWAKAEDFWEGGVVPAWAYQWGSDEFGPWVVFRIGQVEQRLRWVPPGRFWMGSPKEEAGRWEDEGPRHEVILTRGYWLFETPCTQALWQAVLGANPSQFKGPGRPVEQVSWEDCQAFEAKANAQTKGLSLRLPTEAEWEYACRAGTGGARYAEDLDAIAWYEGNSENKTHVVAEKLPNAWGLYDMLGNVSEWCQDGQRRYTQEAVTDPTGPTEAGAHRVFRGGNWKVPAWNMRVAYRNAADPGLRLDRLGFRCSSSE